MKRTHKDEEEKKLRRLWKEYEQTRRNRWARDESAGHWEAVEPYQNGWTRRFVLREDIRNRTDARDIRQALDLINSDQFSRRQDFLWMNWKTGQLEPRGQKLNWITVEKYETLGEKLKSCFVYREWSDYEGYLHKKKVDKKGYFIKHEYWFVLAITPNIITHHWIPDTTYDSRHQELHNKIFKGGLYGKVSKSMGWSQHTKDNMRTPKMQNKYGTAMLESDFDLHEDAA